MRSSFKVVTTDTAKCVYDWEPPMAMRTSLLEVMGNFRRMFDAAPGITAACLHLDPPNRSELYFFEHGQRIWDFDPLYANTAFAAAAWPVERRQSWLLNEAANPVGIALADLPEATLRLIMLRDGARISPWCAWGGRIAQKMHWQFRPLQHPDASGHELVLFGADQSFEHIEAFASMSRMS